MLRHRFHRQPNRLPTEVYRAPGRFFLTLCTEARATHFARESIVRAVQEELQVQATAHHVEIDAYCFMPDHLHLLVSSTEGADVPSFVRLFKQRAAFWLRKRRAILLWQKGYFDHVLRHEEESGAVAEYILHNPVRAGLCERWQDHPFSWSRWHDRE